jgi:dimethylglycine dehydrogenase
MSLRLEKNWGTWAREYRPIYGPYEAGLGRFVSLRKNRFHRPRRGAGRKGNRRRTPSHRLHRRRHDVDVIGDEPIWHDNKVVGWITSGGYAHWARQSVALGYVPRGLAESDNGFEIEIIGKRYPASVQREPVFDPAGDRMRS